MDARVKGKLNQRMLAALKRGRGIAALAHFAAILAAGQQGPIRGATQMSAMSGSGKPQASTVLSSGVPTSFSVPNNNGLTQLSGDFGFQITVPPGSTTLLVQLITTTPGIDMDLYVRAGQDVGIDSGQPVADYRVEGLTGNETLLITTGSTPPLSQGTYFIALGQFNPGAPNGTITATVGRGPPPPVPAPIIYPWQTDWSAFTDALKPFIATLPIGASGSIIHHPKFEGKQVTWSGMVSSNPGSNPENVAIRMSPPVDLRTSNGATGSLGSLFLIPRSTDRGSWTSLRSGEAINFRATLGSTLGPGDRGFLLIGIIRGQIIAFMDAYDAELLGQPPSITQGGVVNGASFRPGIAARSWFTIQGGRLSNTTRIWSGSDFQGNKLPTALDGVSVQVNGKDAAIYFISPGQINALAPDENSTGTVNVTVKSPAGVTSASTNLQQVAPALFQFDPQNRRYVAAVHPDGAYVGPAGLFGSGANVRPLLPGGRALLFGTGFGDTNPRPPAGEVFSGAFPLNNPSDLTLTIGGQKVVVEFAGLISPGLYQFNIVAPTGLAGGDQAVVASIGSFRSQDGAYISLSPGTDSTRPDLILTEVKSAPTGLIGQRLRNVSITVKNQGPGAAPSFRVGFYLGRNMVAGPADVFTGWLCLVQNGLQPQQSYSCVSDIGIPTSITPGAWYLFANADDQGAVDDSNRSNNIRAAEGGPVTFSVPTGNDALPDFTVISLRAPVAGVAGQKLTGASVTIRNDGATTTKTANAGFYFSRTSSPSLGDIFTNWLCVWNGGVATLFTSSCTTDIPIPTTLTPGVWYLSAIANYDASVEEADRNNNRRVADTGAITITSQ